MATVINNPSGGSEGSSVGVIVGVLVAIIIVVLFFVYGLPALRGGAPAPADNGGIDVNVDFPSGGDSSPAPSGGGGIYQ